MDKKIKVIVTGGGCIEKIDAVRAIKNTSSGKLASQIIDELPDNTEIVYIHGIEAAKPSKNTKNIKDIPVLGVLELYDAMKKELLGNPDYVIHAMAVSDYTVDYTCTPEMLAENIKESDDNVTNSIINNKNTFNKNDKLSSYEDNIIIKLKKSPKIISIVKELCPTTCLIGFKLLSDVSEEELISVAQALKDKNNCNYVVANDIKNISDTQHKALLIGKNIKKLQTKKEIAKAIREIVNGNYKDT